MPSKYQQEVEARVPPVDCPCAGCAALLAEIGADLDLYALTRKKLLIRGWVGKATQAEKLYQRSHASWVRAAVERAGQNLPPGYRKTAKNP